MGLEALTLLMDISATYAYTRQLLAEKRFSELETDSGSMEKRFECNCEAFIVEAHLSCQEGFDPQLKLETALCNPADADLFLAEFAALIFSRCECRVYFMTASRLGLAFDTAVDAPEAVSQAVIREGAVLRSNWQAMFGPRVGKIRVADAYTFVGVDN